MRSKKEKKYTGVVANVMHCDIIRNLVNANRFTLRLIPKER